MSVGRIATTCLIFLLPYLFVGWRTLAEGQSPTGSVYRLVFHNRYVQAFDLELGPDRQAPIHDNSNDLLWLSLDSGILEFESRDGMTRDFQFDAGDVRLFGRHEVASLRNRTAGPTHAAVLELPRLGRGGCGCSTEAERVVCGCDRSAHLPPLWALVLDGATLAETTLEPGQSLQEASNRNDTLLVAVRPLQLDHEMIPRNASQQAVSNPARLALGAGGVAWLPEGRHRLSNLGDQAARFITIEF
jgi:hypothetical protein